MCAPACVRARTHTHTHHTTQSPVFPYCTLGGTGQHGVVLGKGSLKQQQLSVPEFPLQTLGGADVYFHEMTLKEARKHKS